MAERLDTLPDRNNRLYPWAEWTDGSVWRITRGEDFEVSPASMAAMVRLRAKAEGLTATCRLLDDETVAFQFSTPNQEAA